MKPSAQATKILEQIKDTDCKLGDLRKLAKEIKKDHSLAEELWASGLFFARQLAILIMDKKRLSEEGIDALVADMNRHPDNEKVQLMDWLMANQLTKDKQTVVRMESWMDSPLALKRRAFWYYQARLRWMGQTPPANNGDLLTQIENRIESETPAVQWAMNFLAGWIGVYDKVYRARCVALGEKTGLYKGDMVSKGCTPNYLPAFIATEAQKRDL